MDNKVAEKLQGGSQETKWDALKSVKELTPDEIIARRGVGSDIVVDTQIPQQSIYLMTEDGSESFKDTDSELYGLNDRQIESVRARFAFLKDRSTESWHLEQDAHLAAAVKAAFESNETHKKIAL